MLANYVPRRATRNQEILGHQCLFYGALLHRRILCNISRKDSLLTSEQIPSNHLLPVTDLEGSNHSNGERLFLVLNFHRAIGKPCLIPWTRYLLATNCVLLTGRWAEWAERAA